MLLSRRRSEALHRQARMDGQRCQKHPESAADVFDTCNLVDGHVKVHLSGQAMNEHMPGAVVRVLNTAPVPILR